MALKHLELEESVTKNCKISYLTIVLTSTDAKLRYIVVLVLLFIFYNFLEIKNHKNHDFFKF